MAYVPNTSSAPLPLGGKTVSAGSWSIVFAGLAVIGFLNGSAHRAILAIEEDPANALLTTFDISVIIWVAIAAAAMLIWNSRDRRFTGFDYGIVMLLLLMFAAPIGPLSWVGLAIMSIYILRTSVSRSPSARGATILLALTIPMFWTKALLSLAGEPILRFEAAMVAFLTGVHSSGNAIAFHDGWGYYWIAPECSSLANVSLAFLTWILVSELPERENRIPLRYGFMAVGAVIAINVARTVITGFSRAHFELLHGPAGNFFIGFLSLAAMIGICLWGARQSRTHAQF